MKMNFSFRYFTLLILLLHFSFLRGQFFAPPQAFMNDNGYDGQRPPANTSEMRLHRYIPGARFPGDFDVLLEDFSYDKQGHLLKWRKFQSVSGDLMLETTYQWNEAGLMLQEAVAAAGNPMPMVRDFVWAAEGNDGSQKASIKNSSGKVIGSLVVYQDGRRTLTESIGDGSKSVVSEYTAAGKLLRVHNDGTGITEEFSYDNEGFLKAIEAKSPSGVGGISYTSKFDQNGKIHSQTETGKGAPKTMYFRYDENGRMISKGNSTTHIGEMRNYDPWGRLNDVVYFDDLGFPKEVLFISYTRF